MAGEQGRRTDPLPQRWLSVIGSDPSRELRIVRGDGAQVWDDESRQYLDLVTGGGVNVLGHAHPQFVSALESQLRTLASVQADFGHDAQEEFVEALSLAMPDGLTRMVITNSASEAVDAAVRLACAATGRTQIVAADGALHGSTLLGSLLSDVRDVAPTPLNLDLVRVPYDDIAALERSLNDRVAAVIVEPMQWGTVARAPAAGYLTEVKALCRATGCLLIVDEVQTALRTWPPLLSSRQQVLPDIVCLGSSIANGFPIGAAVAGDAVVVPAAAAIRGGTTAGIPLACAAGAATLRTLADAAIRTRVNESGDRLQQRLRALRIAQIKRVTGEGTLASVELHADAPGVVRGMRDNGLLVRPSVSGEIRLVPPSVIEPRQVDEIVEGLAAAILESRHSRRRRPDDTREVELRGVAARPKRGANRPPS